MNVRNFIGDRNFYKQLFFIVVPMVLQSIVMNFAGLLDNVMVGQMGTVQMNSVAVVNQLLFVYNLCVWGSVCGAGIFTTQFFGKNDYDGVRDTLRVKIVLSLFFTIIFVVVMFLFSDSLILKFLHDNNDECNVAEVALGTGNVSKITETLTFAKKYLYIILIGLFPLAFNFAYSNTLRDVGNTSLPMKAGVISVFVNVILNYLLIFGKFGFPCLGVEGAAIATVISRFVECFINVLFFHKSKSNSNFSKNVFSSIKVPLPLIKNIIKKGLPLCANETLWAVGLTWMNQCYSLRGLSVVAAFNINSTIMNIFNVFLFAMGEAIAIIVGHLLGAGKEDEAKKTVSKLLFTSFTVCLFIGFAMFLFRGAFPSFYNTEEDVKALAKNLITVAAFFLPVMSLVHGSYFTLRCGGKTIVTFLFDSFFICFVTLPLAFCLSHFTNLNILHIYIAVSSMDFLKAALGLVLVKKGVWIQKLV